MTIESPAWSTVSSRVVFHSPWLELRRDRTVLPDGSPGEYDHVVVPGSVCVLAIDGDGRVPVTRQWIYPHGGSQWRLPTGRVDPGDASPTTAALRELREETGLVAAELSPLGTVHCADSFTNHREHAFLARGLTATAQSLEPGEADLLVRWFPAADVLAMAVDGLLPHAGSAFAVLAAHARGILG